jgi:hypothetical protein
MTRHASNTQTPARGAAHRRSASSEGISRTPVTNGNAETPDRKIAEQDRKCAICHEEFTDYNDIVPDHRDPKGMGGSWRDDHPDNIQATHSWCNEEKGSNRVED